MMQQVIKNYNCTPFQYFLTFSFKTFFQRLELLFKCFTQFGGSSLSLNFDKFRDTVSFNSYY